jgi:UDP:flavonoid glycosyltransferase YjiC (YdhE family)
VTRVLFAWELGAAYGHLARAVAIAQRLRTEDCEFVVAARDVEVAHSLLTPSEVQFVAAPHYRRQTARTRSAVNYSDMLSECGYSDPKELRALLHAWINLLHMIAPDAVIVDHAPTALLAAKVLAIPRVLIGTGFSVPPAVDPMPLLRTGVTRAELAAADAGVLACVNNALRAVAQPPLAQVAELFAGAPALITSFRELDHYLDRDHATFIGPVSPPRQLPSAGWTGDGRQARIFAYLHANFPRLVEVLSALSAIDAEVLCVVPGAATELARRFGRDRFTIRDFPVDVGALLPQANLVITHGGAGLTTQALVAGIALLLIPRSLEQEISARRVADLGAGAVVGAQRSSDDFVKMLTHVLTEPAFASAARFWASRFANRDPQRAVDTIVQTVLQIARPQPVAANA